MRRYAAWAAKSVWILGTLLLLLHAGNRLEAVQKLQRLAVYEMEPTADTETAERLLSEALFRDGEEETGTSGGGYAHDMVFFTEYKGETLENPSWYREIETDVVALKGDSTLLFPYAYPLEAEDQRGCLLGEETALSLFGGRRVTGEQVVFGGETYEIRGMIPGEDILVIQAAEGMQLHMAGVWGDSVPKRQEPAQWLQNVSGMLLREIPFRFYENLVRLELVLLFALLYAAAGWELCRLFPGKKALRRAVIAAGVLGMAAGMVFVLSLSAYTMPDRISDLSWWRAYFTDGRAQWRAFFGREEMFLQERFQSCLHLF